MRVLVSRETQRHRMARSSAVQVSDDEHMEPRSDQERRQVLCRSRSRRMLCLPLGPEQVHAGAFRERRAPTKHPLCHRTAVIGEDVALLRTRPWRLICGYVPGAPGSHSAPTDLRRAGWGAASAGYDVGRVRRRPSAASAECRRGRVRRGSTAATAVTRQLCGRSESHARPDRPRYEPDGVRERGRACGTRAGVAGPHGGPEPHRRQRRTTGTGTVWVHSGSAGLPRRSR